MKMLVRKTRLSFKRYQMFYVNYWAMKWFTKAIVIEIQESREARLWIIAGLKYRVFFQLFKGKWWWAAAKKKRADRAITHMNSFRKQALQQWGIWSLINNSKVNQFQWWRDEEKAKDMRYSCFFALVVNIEESWSQKEKYEKATKHNQKYLLW